MANSFSKVERPVNEPILGYLEGSQEKKALQEVILRRKNEEVDIPMIIGGEEIRTSKTVKISPPHNHQHTLGHFHYGDDGDVKQAINAALGAKHIWQSTPWELRAAVFLKAADLAAGKYRAELNAATILGQSKTVFQAEIDAACELVDFLRYNVYFTQELYKDQPQAAPGMWNRMEYRPLEGFVFAVSPFNFTAIAANLPALPAILGNTVVWKPKETQAYSAHVIMQIFKEAGLPDGVINLVFVDGEVAGDVVFNHRSFAGLNFVGSTAVFRKLWANIGQKLDTYVSYPRISGETGGKDFIIAHKSANPEALATAMIRGAFEFSGQKCSAASRAYIPANLWEEVKGLLIKKVKELKIGSPEEFDTFTGAVIDRTSFEKIKSYIDHAHADPLVEVITGGTYDDSVGYFVQPTILKVEDNQYQSMKEEIFGPVLSVYVYTTELFEEALELVDTTSPYALTGAIFATDRYAIDLAQKKLMYAAGNFYINDKPTGAVVGQQPFGGGRASGTNDKAGAAYSLMKWVLPRTIKETFDPPTEVKYPYMEQ